MKLSKKEKDYWRCHYNISSASAIPAEMGGIVSIDTEMDDEQLFYLCSRVGVIRAFDLENTNITDEGVKHISGVNGVEKLALIHNRLLTANCLQFISGMPHLRILNLLKSPVTLADAKTLHSLPALKELHISADQEDEQVWEQVILLEELLPGCKVYLNYEGIN